MLKESIRYQLMNSGADLVGFADISNLNNPLYEGYNTAISIGVKLFDSVVNTIIDAPTYMYLQHYEATNTKIDQIVLAGGVYLENLGYKAMPVGASQTNPHEKDKLTSFFSHKTAARLSGLGHIGKSALMITKEYGPRIRFGTLLSNLPLEHDEPMTENLCGNCQICKKACPAGAITGNNFIIDLSEVSTSTASSIKNRATIYNAQKCHTHIKTQFGVSGGGKVCGICMSHCPLGKPGNRGWSPDTETEYNEYL